MVPQTRALPVPKHVPLSGTLVSATGSSDPAYFPRQIAAGLQAVLGWFGLTWPRAYYELMSVCAIPGVVHLSLRSASVRHPSRRHELRRLGSVSEDAESRYPRIDQVTSQDRNNMIEYKQRQRLKQKPRQLVHLLVITEVIHDVPTPGSVSSANAGDAGSSLVHTAGGENAGPRPIPCNLLPSALVRPSLPPTPSVSSISKAFHTSRRPNVAKRVSMSCSKSSCRGVNMIVSDTLLSSLRNRRGPVGERSHELGDSGEAGREGKSGAPLVDPGDGESRVGALVGRAGILVFVNEARRLGSQDIGWGSKSRGTEEDMGSTGEGEEEPRRADPDMSWIGEARRAGLECRGVTVCGGGGSGGWAELMCKWNRWE